MNESFNIEDLSDYTQQGYEFKVEGDKTVIIHDGRFVGIVSNTSSLSDVRGVIDNAPSTTQFAYDDTNHTILTDFVSKIESQTGKKVDSIVFKGGDSYELVVDGEKVTIPYTESGSISLDDVTSRVEKKETSSLNGNDLVSEDNIYDVTEYLRNNISGHEIEYKIIDGECYIVFDGTTYKVDSNTKISDVVYSFSDYLDTKSDTTPMAMQDTSAYYNKNYKQKQDYQAYRIDISEDVYREIISNLKEIDEIVTSAEPQYDDSDLTGKLGAYYASLGVDNHSEFEEILNQSEDLQLKIDYSLELYNSTDENMQYFFNEMVNQIFAYDNFANGGSFEDLTYEQRRANISSYLSKLESTYETLYAQYKELFGEGVPVEREKVNQMMKLFNALGIFSNNYVMEGYSDENLFTYKDCEGNALATPGPRTSGEYQYLDANYWQAFITACDEKKVIPTIRKYIEEGQGWEESGMEKLFGENLKAMWQFWDDPNNPNYDIDSETIFLYRYFADKHYGSFYDSSDVGVSLPEGSPQYIVEQMKDINFYSYLNKVSWVNNWIEEYQDAGVIEGYWTADGDYIELEPDEFDDDGNPLIELKENERFVTKYENWIDDGKEYLFVGDFFPEDIRTENNSSEAERQYVINYLQTTPINELVHYNRDTRFDVTNRQQWNNSGYYEDIPQYTDINARQWYIGNNEKLINQLNEDDNYWGSWDDDEHGSHNPPYYYWFGRDYVFTETYTLPQTDTFIKDSIIHGEYGASVDVSRYEYEYLTLHGFGPVMGIMAHRPYFGDMFYTGSEFKEHELNMNNYYFYGIKNKEKCANFLKNYIKDQDIFSTYDTIKEKTSDCIAMQSDLSSLANQVYSLKQYKKLMPYEELRKDPEYLKYLGTDFGTQSGELAWLDQTELAIYYYLKAQNDAGDYHAGTTSNYIKALEDTLNQRKGFYYAAQYVEELNAGHKTADELREIWAPLGDVADIFAAADGMMISGTEGFLSGVFTFGKGFYNLVAADGVRDASDYAMLYKATLMSSQNEYNENMPDWAREMYRMNNQVMSAVGNMAIPALLSMVPYAGPYLSKAALFMSTMGNTTENAMQQGYSAGQAYLFGAVSATATLLSEWALGSIPGLGSNAPNLALLKGWDYVKALGVSMLQEGATEALQTYMDAGLRYYMLGEPFDISTVTEEAFQAFIMGAITAGLMNGGVSLAVKLKNGKKLYLDPTKLEDFERRVGDNAQIIGIDDDGNVLIRTKYGAVEAVDPYYINSDSTIRNVIRFDQEYRENIMSQLNSDKIFNTPWVKDVYTRGDQIFALLINGQEIPLSGTIDQMIYTVADTAHFGYMVIDADGHQTFQQINRPKRVVTVGNVEIVTNLTDEEILRYYNDSWDVRNPKTKRKPVSSIEEIPEGFQIPENVNGLKETWDEGLGRMLLEDNWEYQTTKSGGSPGTKKEGKFIVGQRFNRAVNDAYIVYDVDGTAIPAALGDDGELIPLFYYDPAKGEYVPIDPDASFDAGTYLTVEGDVVQDYDSKATPATRGSQVSYEYEVVKPLSVDTIASEIDSLPADSSLRKQIEGSILHGRKGLTAADLYDSAGHIKPEYLSLSVETINPAFGKVGHGTQLKFAVSTDLIYKLGFLKIVDVSKSK